MKTILNRHSFTRSLIKISLVMLALGLFFNIARAESLHPDTFVHSDTDQIRMTFQGEVKFVKKMTAIPAVVCIPRPDVRCPKSEPYYTLVIKLDESISSLTEVHGTSTPLGTAVKPLEMRLGNTRVREGEIVEVDALLDRIFTLGLIKRIYRVSSISSAPQPDPIRNLGPGYRCNLRNAMDVTYDQMTIYVVDIRTNRFDGRGDARVIADSTMRSPTYTILDNTASFQPHKLRSGVQLHTEDGQLQLDILSVRATPRPRLVAEATLYRGVRAAKLTGNCSYQQNVIRQ